MIPLDLVPFQSLEHYRGLGFRSSGDWDDLPSDVADGQYSLHQRYKHEWGFFLPTSDVMGRLVTWVRKEIGPSARILDAGSGSGYMSKELCRRGVNTFAVERCEYESRDRKFGYPIIKVYQRDALGDAVQYVSKGFDAVLLTWPPYDWPFAIDIARAMSPGQWLIYEGEFRGCCADDAFFDYVGDHAVWDRPPEIGRLLNAVHVTFYGLHDHWAIWRKK